MSIASCTSIFTETDFDGLSPSILNLNDDCLREIFTHLDLIDQVEYSDVCYRFNEIAHEFFRKDKILQLDHYSDEYNDFEWMRILSVVGCYKNEAFVNDSKYVDWLSEFCPNLEQLIVRDLWYCEEENFNRFKYIFAKLHTLEMSNCHLVDDLCLYMRDCHKLENLNLSDNRYLTGLHLNEFQNLHSLIISGTNFSSGNFISVCSGSPRISRLAIFDCQNLDRLALGYIFNYKSCLEILAIELEQIKILDFQITDFTVLKELLIYNCKSIQSALPDKFLKSLPSTRIEILLIDNIHLNTINFSLWNSIKSLKKITFERCSGVTDELLTELSNLDLTYFKCWYGNITDVGVANFLGNCKTITEIGIFYCKKITEAVVLQTIEQLKISPRIHRLTMSLLFFNEGIPLIDEDPVIKTYSDMLKLRLIK